MKHAHADVHGRPVATRFPRPARGTTLAVVLGCCAGMGWTPVAAAAAHVAAGAGSGGPGGGSSPVDITDFGAIPDDGLDDRTAIQAALDVACAEGRSLFVPAGVFDLSVPLGQPPSVPRVILTIDCTDLEITGAGQDTSWFRLLDAQPPWESLLGTPAFPNPADGLRIRDLGFDGNGVGNPVDGDADVADIFRSRRHAIRVYRGTDIVIERCRFTGWRTVNTITLNGVGVSDVVVRDCVFDETGGAPPGFADWDHSSIYTDCDGAVIADNVFSSADGPGTFGVRAAIEVHGPNQLVTGNQIFDFTTGMNVTGISVLGSTDVVVRDSVMIGVSDGIRLWTADLPDDPPGPSLVACVIEGTEIEIETDGWRATQDQFGLAPTGISIENSSDGAIDGLTIADLVVRYRPVTTSRSWDRNGHAIRLSSFSQGPTFPIADVRLEDILIEGPLATGLFLDAAFDDLLVRDVTVRGAGAGGDSVVAGLRSGGLVGGVLRDVVFERICIEDPDDQLGQGWYLFPENEAVAAIRNGGFVTGPSPAPWTRDDGGLGVPWEIEPPRATCPRAADVDRDDVVGFSDLLAVLGAWGPCPGFPSACSADVDGDGAVGFGDVISVLADWR